MELSQINQTIRLLEDKGFTKHQMRKALPLLYYNKNLVEEGLKIMKEADPDLDWHEELKKDYALQLCLYYVEKCFDFRPDGFLVGFQPKLTDELLEEMKKSTNKMEEKVEELQENKEKVEEVMPISNDSVIKFLSRQQTVGSNVVSGDRTSRMSMAKTGVRQLHTSASSDLARGDVLATFYYQAGSGGTNIVGLRNPLREMQVKAEFNLLRQWDPSVTYESFVEAAQEVM